MSLPETEKTQLPVKGDAFMTPVIQLLGLTVIAFVLGAVQIPVALSLANSQFVYAAAAGFIAAAILAAWTFGLWRAAWFVRVAAALICVAIPSWPVIGLFLFAACYFGPCQFP